MHSPHTASVDFVGMCQALVREITSAGGAVRLGTQIRSVSEDAFGVAVRSATDAWTFDQLIVCAGLTGDHLAAQLGGLADMRIIPFGGNTTSSARWPGIGSRAWCIRFPTPATRSSAST